MANNPLYPGYYPEPKYSNPSPLYPGYFPGKAYPRMPINKNFVAPVEFNFDDFYKYIDTIDYTVSNVTVGLPAYTWSRITDDFNQALKAGIKPAGVGAEDLDDYDTESLPGAFGLTISLNPADWIEDPAGKLKDTVTSWAKGIYDWKDLDNRYREQLWNQITSENPDYSAGNMGVLAEAAGDAIFRRTSRPVTYRLDGSTVNPMSLENVGIMAEDPSGFKQRRYVLQVDPATGAPTGGYELEKDIIPQVDAFAKVRQNIIKFERDQGFAPLRNAAYDGLLFNSVRAIDAELNSPGFQYQLQTRMNNMSAGQVEAFTTAQTGFSVRHDILERMNIIDKTVADTQELFEKQFVRNHVFNAVPRMQTPESVNPLAGGRIRLNSKEWQKIANPDDGLYKSLGDTLSNLDLQLDRMRKLNNRLATEEADRLEKFTNGYRKHLENIRKDQIFSIVPEYQALHIPAYEGLKAGLTRELAAGTITQADFDTKIAGLFSAKGTTEKEYLAKMAELENRIGNQTARDVANRLNAASKGSLLNRGIGGGDLVVSSYKSQLAHDTLDNHFLKANYHGYTVDDIIKEVPGAHSTKLKAYLGRIRYENDVQAIDEFTTALEKGKLFENYVWKRNLNRFKDSSPSFYATQFLEQSNFFGLIIGSETQDNFEKSIVGRLSRGVPTAAPGRVFGNHFKIGGDDNIKKGFGYTTQIGGKSSIITISGRMYGGNHFKGVASINKIRNKVGAGKDAWTIEGFSYFYRYLKDEKQLDISTAEGLKFFTTLAAKNNKTLDTTIEELSQLLLNEKDLVTNLKAFKEWYKNNKDKINTNVTNKDDINVIAALIGALAKKNGNPDFKTIGIVKRYSGLLEKAWAKGNEIQSALARSPLGKLIAPISYIKTIVAEAVADFLPWLVGLLAGAVSGGTLAAALEPIMEALKPLIRWITRKTLDAMEVFFKGLLQGDVFFVVQTLEKVVGAWLKVFMITLSIPVLGLMIISQVFWGATATSVSPVDPTRNPSTIDYFGLRQRGSGIQLANEVKRPSSTRCFEFVDFGPAFGTHTMGKWEADKVAGIEFAIKTLQEHSGGYLDRLCNIDDNLVPIKLHWAAQGTGYCGEVFTGSDIVFYPMQDTNNDGLGDAGCRYLPNLYTAYLFSHETGHIYKRRNGWAGFELVDDGEGTLPTYPGDANKCTNQPSPSASQAADEDFAETIGDWVSINRSDCQDGTPIFPLPPDSAFWSIYQKHYDYANEVLFKVGE